MFVVYRNRDPKTFTKTYTSITGLTEEDILFNDVTPRITEYAYKATEYVTMKTRRGDLSSKYRGIFEQDMVPNINTINNVIQKFFTDNNFLDNKPSFYTRFRIPKRKGGYRELIDPAPELKFLQRTVLDFLTDTLQLLPHNAAHGFVKHRDMYTNALQHKGSRHIVAMDLADFFPSITEELLQTKLSDISFLAQAESHEFLNSVIQLATLDGCLPQGSPLSPFLSNLIMIDFDYHISLTLKEFNQFIRYSRYADDMTFSSQKPIDLANIKLMVNTVIHQRYNDQIKVQESKTKYLMNTKRCFITGIKYNQEKNLTIGHEKKKELKHNLHQLFVKFVNGDLTKEECQEVLGYFSFLSRVEPNYARYLEQRYLRIFHSQSLTLHNHFKSLL